MDNEKIRLKMTELQEKIGYQFSDINWLSAAMKSEKIEVRNVGKNHKEYTNEGLATVGDAVLKAVISDFLYKGGVTRKGEITTRKSELENNKSFRKIMTDKKLIEYAYNNEYFQSDNPPKHKQVVNKKHDPYIEAIVGAVHYDAGFDKTKKWIIEWLLPLLEKYRLNN